MGARRMPWRGKSMKGVASCDKQGVGANNRYHPLMPEWGNPREVMLTYHLSESNRKGEDNLGN